MNDYFIRCRVSARPQLLRLGVLLGLLAVNEQGEHEPAIEGVAWHVIGPLYRVVDDLPVIRTAPDGEPYWHANLRVPFDSLLQYAQAVQAEAPNPELAQALQGFGDYFLLTPDGEQARPDSPAVIFL